MFYSAQGRMIHSAQCSMSYSSAQGWMIHSAPGPRSCSPQGSRFYSA